MTASFRRSFRRTAARPALIFSATALLVFGTSGCARYFEFQAQRVIPADTRIVLDWQQRLSLSLREIPGYRCPEHFMFVCERGGAITASCTCLINP